MRQSTTKILGAQKNILALAGALFQNTNIKVSKTAITLKDGILEAGTIVDNTGKKVTDGTAFGIVYEDVDFNNSSGTEVVPVTIFGFVKESVLPEKPTAEVKAALPMIKFL
ncbi:hypothetical protein [Clostridium cochlearium]|uniref:Uncharacterized protein n=1 Tax=Clostridium cochlearium TaxID=1494 RepID=A0A7Y3V5H8_CLOCO|nr:hypothetical protein [Clostridium cochlearium]NOH14866.1 hypothetical protein [Clostridium cochlearium]